MSGFLTFLNWTVRILAGLFVALHLYALALIWLPIPGTVLMVQRAVGGETVRREAAASLNLGQIFSLSAWLSRASRGTKGCIAGPNNFRSSRPLTKSISTCVMT